MNYNIPIDPVAKNEIAIRDCNGDWRKVNQKVCPSRVVPAMSSNLSTFVDKLVTIITTDGRLLVGYLRGYDQTTNLILSAAQERTISPDEPGTTEDLGLYILRGDNVALVGETDEGKDQSINW